MKDHEDILRDALKDASVMQNIEIPEEVDRRIMAVIDTKIDQITETQSPFRILQVYKYAAAAAAVAVICGLLAFPSRETATAAADIDIVSAYMLAAKLEADKAPSLDYDLNKDGTVNHLDVDELARRAVALSPKESKES